jgi:hypothetical protein
MANTTTEAHSLRTLQAAISTARSYSFSFLLSTVPIRRWHLSTAEMTDTCENGAELCTYTNIHPPTCIHTYIHTYLTQYKTFSSNGCPPLAPMWNCITLSYLCDPVESSSGCVCVCVCVCVLPTFGCVKFWRHNKTSLYDSDSPNFQQASNQTLQITSTYQWWPQLHKRCRVYDSHGVLCEVRNEHIQGVSRL